MSHPNICQTYDVGVIDGQYVMAMEYIDGKTLAAFAKPGKLLSERQVVSLVKKVALAVEAAHHQGMIHRDLKPGNIMLPKPTPSRKTIEPKVMDFGLAKSLDARTTELTKSGMIVGTPCYMSKEQWSGKDAQLGPPCDVYSLGVILYELLTGSLPYDVEDGEPATSWFVKLVTEPQRRPSERKPDIDAGLDAIVMKAIAKEPSDRFATMADFARTLEAWLKGKPVTGQTLLGIQLGALADVKPSHSAKPKPGGGWRGIVTKPLVEVLTASHRGSEPSVQDVTASVQSRSENSFTIRVLCPSVANWEWQYDCDEVGGSWTVTKATLNDASPGYGELTGEKLVDSSRVNITPDGLEIIRSRPVAEGLRQAHFKFCRETNDSDNPADGDDVAASDADSGSVDRAQRQIDEALAKYETACLEADKNLLASDSRELIRKTEANGSLPGVELIDLFRP